MRDAVNQDPANPIQREVPFEYTPSLPGILEQLNLSLLITTYQAGKLLVVGSRQGQLRISYVDLRQPMGLAIHRRRIAIGTRREICFFYPAHETVQANREGGRHDGCWVPRSSHFTGTIQGHDLAWGHAGLWVVNTLFSCLCTLHPDFSFVPRWRPPFISALASEDRCHLNGLAVADGEPRFVTALAESDTPGGWRPSKTSGGVVIDVRSGATISSDLCMPHSPRVHEGRLWVLNSGYGSLGTVDPSTGRYEQVGSAPGYTRGLAFCGTFAFFGLSKIRETAVFGGLPVAQRGEELRCGVGVIDLVSGRTVSVLQFLSGVDEIFAVDVIPGMTHPKIAGAWADQVEQEVWIAPAPNSAPPRLEPMLPPYAPLAARPDLDQVSS